MFTGIVQGKYPVVKVENMSGLKRFMITFHDALLENLEIGASVSLNGACHTVVEIQNNNVIFDSMEETLRKTTLGSLKEGDFVNIERSASMGDEIGGHVMSGHVFGEAEIVDIQTPENNYVITFKVPTLWMKYIFEKGFVGLHGCSLTIVNAQKENGTFEVWLIPETLRQTVFGDLRIGDKVNVEIDARTQTIVETVEEYLKTTNSSKSV